MKTNTISLNEFLELVFIVMSDKKAKLPRSDEPWCRTLYKLKKSGRFPITAVNELAFDWDGPYPTCPSFRETFQSFTATSCIEMLMPSGAYVLNEGVIAFWKRKFHGKQKLSAAIRRSVDELVNELEKETGKLAQTIS